MNDIVISAEHLSKEYRLGTINHGTLTRDIQSWWARLRGKEDPNSVVSSVHPVPSAGSPRFLALNDVSFDAKRGETLGIIGRNGAGKSTLLKILSRVTAPTKGLVKIKGRIASLLEVGTGFHPELTGRENIYLNGAILGMTKAEISRKFDEIVAFSEVDKFLDTPVKRYSSGMYVRLAFAVAAHLEPEILIVDEVLSVGDAQFQKKCLGKMEATGKEGRTVLFVSHNMTALKSLCSRTIWLNNGCIIDDGESGTVVARYLNETAKVIREQQWPDNDDAPGNDKIRLLKVRLVPEANSDDHRITVETPLSLEFDIHNFLPEARLNFSLHLYTMDGTCVLNSGSPAFTAKRGYVKGVCRIPANLLNAETYRVKIMLVKDTSINLYSHSDAMIFDVHDIEREGSWYGKWAGVVRPKLEWLVEE